MSVASMLILSRRMINKKLIDASRVKNTFFFLKSQEYIK